MTVVKCLRNEVTDKYRFIIFMSQDTSCSLSILARRPPRHPTPLLFFKKKKSKHLGLSTKAPSQGQNVKLLTRGSPSPACVYPENLTERGAMPHSSAAAKPQNRRNVDALVAAPAHSGGIQFETHGSPNGNQTASFRQQPGLQRRVRTHSSAYRACVQMTTPSAEWREAHQ